MISKVRCRLDIRVRLNIIHLFASSWRGKLAGKSKVLEYSSVATNNKPYPSWKKICHLFVDVWFFHRSNILPTPISLMVVSFKRTDRKPCSALENR